MRQDQYNGISRDWKGEDRWVAVTATSGLSAITELHLLDAGRYVLKWSSGWLERTEHDRLLRRLWRSRPDLFLMEEVL